MPPVPPASPCPLQPSLLGQEPLSLPPSLAPAPSPAQTAVPAAAPHRRGSGAAATFSRCCLGSSLPTAWSELTLPHCCRHLCLRRALGSPPPEHLLHTVVSRGGARPPGGRGHATSKGLVPVLPGSTRGKGTLGVSSGCLLAVRGSETASSSLLRSGARSLAALASRLPGAPSPWRWFQSRVSPWNPPQLLLPEVPSGSPAAGRTLGAAAERDERASPARSPRTGRAGRGAWRRLRRCPAGHGVGSSPARGGSCSGTARSGAEQSGGPSLGPAAAAPERSLRRGTAGSRVLLRRQFALGQSSPRFCRSRGEEGQRETSSRRLLYDPACQIQAPPKEPFETSQ